MKLVRLSAVFAIAAVLTACGGRSSLPAGAPPQAAAPAVTQSNVAQSCAVPLPGDQVRCFAEFRTDAGAAVSTEARSAMASSPSGYGPADIRAAYVLPGTAGSGQTVAIVDAYNDPHAEGDMDVYRAHYGLPVCTTGNGCFKKLNQNGVQGSYPATDAGWSQEISLDLDMVSATCPHCRILLIEADSATFANLGAAVNTAVRSGANAVSNSYGGSEFSASNAAYAHPGHVITASAGDDGTGASQPCSYATVVCVGGTTLSRAANARGWSETAWSGTGSGCSASVLKPAWQNQSGCTRRMETDVSAVADPNTGVAVYDSTAFQGISGWMVFGGTSASSPIIAAVYALAGNAATMNAAQSIWQHAGTAALYDVTSGNNGGCTVSFICVARAGYDGPTGWGTPHGTAAF